MRFGLSRAFCAASSASSTIAFSDSSSNSRVDALPCFAPWRRLMVSCWSYWTMFTVIEELAHRVADRSPPSKFTSTASALVMFRTLSVSALISSREYIMVPPVYQRGRAYEELRPVASDALPSQCSTSGRRIPLHRARHAEAVRRPRPSVPRSRVRRHVDVRGRSAGDMWWHPDVPRSLRAAGGVRAVGADGGRVLHAAFPERPVADPERRRAGGPLLFPVALLLRRRPRADQPRRDSEIDAQNALSTR